MEQLIENKRLNPNQAVDGLKSEMRHIGFVVGIFSFFINLLLLTGPIYMLQIYDRVLASRSMSTLVSLSLIMVFLYSVAWRLDSIRSKLLTRFANRFERRISGDAFHVWVHQGLTERNADGVSPLKDLSTLRKFFSSNAITTVFDLPWVPIYLVVIFFLHWTIGLFAIAGTAVIVASALYVELVVKKEVSSEKRHLTQGERISEESRRYAETITAMNMEGHLFNRWQERNIQSVSVSTKVSDRIASARAFTKFFRYFLQSGILGIGAALAIAQIVTPGTMIAGSIILSRALSPAQSIISQWSLLVNARKAYRNISKLPAKPEIDRSYAAFPRPTGLIEVGALVAGPPKSLNPVLVGINFTLQQGDGLAIVGPSAAGKTTLARFLIGVWSPQKGYVRMDGTSIEQWLKIAKLQGMENYIGYLPQNVQLFEGSVKDNITRFSNNINSSALFDACYRAGIHEMIMRLPNGYDTIIGGESFKLSGGQTQRIALARAIYGDPQLVILDEPNSNLDNEGEDALERAVADLRARGKTVIVITHRIGAVASTNKVLILKDGRQLHFGQSDPKLAKLSEAELYHHFSRKRGKGPIVPPSTMTPASTGPIAAGHQYFSASTPPPNNYSPAQAGIMYTAHPRAKTQGN